MSLFDYNPYRTSEDIIPPQLRRPKQMAWIRVLLSPLKRLSDLFTSDYLKGANCSDYDNSTAYSKYDRVIWEDSGVYELRVSSSTGVAPTGNALSSTNWLKALDNFIGLNERMKYNGQLIVFSYAINRHFKISAPPYIYCTEIVPGVVQVFVEINVPNAVYTTLGPNNTSRDNRIKEWASQYTMGGIGIQITPY